MTQHHEKIVCYSLGLRSAPKLEFTGQESRSFFAVQYHAWVLHVGAMMLIVIITFCNRQLELRGEFTQAWRKDHKSHAQKSIGARKVKVHSSRSWWEKRKNTFQCSLQKIISHFPTRMRFSSVQFT